MANYIKKLKVKNNPLTGGKTLKLNFSKWSLIEGNRLINATDYIDGADFTGVGDISIYNLWKKMTVGQTIKIEFLNGNYFNIYYNSFNNNTCFFTVTFYKSNNQSLGALSLIGEVENYENAYRQSGRMYYSLTIEEWTANKVWLPMNIGFRYIVSSGVGKYQILQSAAISPLTALPLNYFEGSIDDSTDPYTEDQDPSTTGGGGSVFTGGDTIGVPSLPSVSVTDTGFVALYNPSETDLRNLASAMWSTDFFDNIIKMWANPMDCILGLSLFPCPVSSTGGEYIKVGNVQIGVPMPKVNTQYVEVDCGTLDFKKGDYNFLDFAPYSQLNIYVPYCGFYAVDIDEVMGKTLGMKYHIDLWSGSCVAYLTVNGSVHKQFTGKCSYNIPITSSNYSNLVNNIVSSVASIGGAIGSGGLSGVGKSIMAVADTVLSAKPTIETNASFGGNVGLLCLQKPFLFLERPDFCLPENGNKLTGYPTYINDKLSNFKGYTEVETVFIKSSKATESEVAEIQALLKGGVFL